MRQLCWQTPVRKDGYKPSYNRTRYAMAKYADDFVIMCKSKEDAEVIYDKLKPYLKTRGLELEPSKTHVVGITEGFDFLSFNIRIYQTSTGEKLLINNQKKRLKRV